ncbi:hypothetical protein BJY52DRAFT_271715 [Lactarius psammicola]|nr:hypothetical protein BJY52DRAFT_271715 [Lactarius psammicola]
MRFYSLLLRFSFSVCGVDSGSQCVEDYRCSGTGVGTYNKTRRGRDWCRVKGSFSSVWPNTTTPDRKQKEDVTRQLSFVSPHHKRTREGRIGERKNEKKDRASLSQSRGP